MGPPSYEEVEADESGNVYVGGRYPRGPNLAKLDAAGREIWRRSVRPEDSQGVLALALRPGGGPVIATRGSADFTISQYDAAGNFVWSAPVAGEFLPRTLLADQAGNVSLRGRGILKLDSGGNRLWEEPVGSGDDLALDASGFVYTISEGLAKLTRDGDVLWNTGPVGSRLILDATGNPYVTSAGRAEYGVSRFDPAGGLQDQGTFALAGCCAERDGPPLAFFLTGTSSPRADPATTSWSFDGPSPRPSSCAPMRTRMAPSGWTMRSARSSISSAAARSRAAGMPPTRTTMAASTSRTRSTPSSISSWAAPPAGPPPGAGPRSDAGRARLRGLSANRRRVSVSVA